MSRTRERSAPIDRVSPDEVWSRVAAEREVAEAGWHVASAEIVSGRRLLGRVVVRAKRGFQRLLHPLPARQSEFNLASLRMTAHLLDVVSRQAALIERLDARVRELERRGTEGE